MAARYERPAGLLITAYVYIVYLIALRFEGCVGQFLCQRIGADVSTPQPLHGHDLLQARGEEVVVEGAWYAQPREGGSEGARRVRKRYFTIHDVETT